MEKVKKSIYDILRGGFLVDDSSVKNWRFIVFVVVLLLVMIFSAHKADEKVVKIGELHNEIRKLKSEYIDTSTSLMKLKMESNIEQKAREIGLKPLQKPPIKIKVIRKE